MIYNPIIEVDENDIKVKMAICPECGNAQRYAILHTMTKQSKKEFMKLVFYNDLQIKTISLEEYNKSNIRLYCKDDCPKRLSFNS
jgi:hypothetical protein